MKTTLILATLLLVSCGTTSTGEKTFAGLTASQWAKVGISAGKSGAAEYSTQKDKAPADVQP